MNLRGQILLAITAPAAASILALSMIMLLTVRADRLADVDATLAGRAAALASYVEWDEGWEVDPVPPHIVASLAGYEIVGDGAVLTKEGALLDRTWEGNLTVETEPEGAVPKEIRVRVSLDAGPVYHALHMLLAQLAGCGTLLTLAAMGVGVSLSRRIVSTDEFLRLQRAWERQSAFAADASHELRTPLAVIRSQAEVTLRHERSPVQYRDALGVILDAARRMQELTEGLLVLARAEDRLEPQDADLAAIVRSSAATFDPPHEPRLVIEVPDAAPIVGDPRLLRILIDNLLANAFRHTRSGSVTVRVSQEGALWVLRVEDTGEGIAPEHLAKVFQRFYRVDGARGRQTGGAGLGLAIVEAVANRHRGTVSITSQLGGGTTIEVRLGRDSRDCT